MAMLTLADADKWMKANGYDTKPMSSETEQVKSNEEYDYRRIPYLGQIVGHMADATTQGVADIFQAVGLERAGNYLNEKVKESSARLPEMRTPELSLDYALDPNGLTSAFAQTVGSMLPGAAAATFVPSGIGITVGQAASKVPLIGGLLGKYVPGAVQWTLGATPIEAGMEKGGTERDLLEQGMSREEAQSRSNDVFLKNLALLAATNTVEGLFAGRLLKGINASKLGGTLPGRLLNFGGAATGEVGINTFEEGEQTGFQETAMGRESSLNPANWSDAQWEAAGFGAAGTLPLALLGLPAAMRGNRTWIANGNAEDNLSENAASQATNEYGTSDDGNPSTAPSGSGEGTTWIKQTGDVSYDGARPETMQAMDALGKWFYEKTGKPLVITAVTNGESHQDGERGHYAGWKFDINDWGSGAEGTILGEEDGTKGSLADELIKYGQSLGLGMNWEGDHIDVSVLGDQWEGEHAGTNFGGMSADARTSFMPLQGERYENTQGERYDNVPSLYDADDTTIMNFAQDRLDNMNAAERPDMAEAYDFFSGIIERGKVTDEERQQIADAWGDDFDRYVSPKTTAAEASGTSTTQSQAQSTPRTFQTGPSQQSTPAIPTQAINTPNLELLRTAQRNGFTGLTRQQPVSSRLFPTGPNDANNKAAQQRAQAVNNAVQVGQYNADLTRNTVNDIVQQIAQQEAARQQAQAAQNQNLPALLPMLPPGRSQQQAQPAIQTPTGGQIAATTADAIAGQQQAAPVSFLRQPQPAGLQQLIQQIMERGNQNAQNQISSPAPAPEVYQAGVNQNPNVEPQAGAPAGIAAQENQVGNIQGQPAQESPQQANITQLIQSIAEKVNTAQNGSNKAGAEKGEDEGRGKSAQNQDRVSTDEFETQRERAIYQQAMRDISDDAQTRKAQGAALIELARIHNIPLDAKLENGLRHGYKKAIKEAQSLIRSTLRQRREDKIYKRAEDGIKQNEREAYAQAYDRMRKAADDLRDGNIAIEEAKAIVQSAYNQYLDSAFVMDARNRRALKQFKDSIDEMASEDQAASKGERNAYSDVIDDVTRELAESRPSPTMPGRKRGSGEYVPGVIDDVTRMIREQDGGRPESNTEKTDTESKQETAPKQTSQKEIQDTTFTFGGKEKINQYETAYTVNMNKVPSKDAVRAMLEDYNNVKVSGKTLTFYNKDAADKFLSDMEKTYGSKVVRQADKHNGFLKNMSPMQQAKADKTLSNLTRYKGQTMTNGELIEKLVAEGREPKEKAGKRGTEYRLYKEDDTFIDLTKTEYDYAKYLTEKQESAPEVSNTSMEEQAETVKGESNNGQEQEQSGGVDGGHEVERAGESEADERSSAGEVSGRDGREGTRVHGSAGEENSGGSRPAGVRTGTELEEATGNGDNSGRDSADVQLTPAQEDPTPTEIPGHDYEIKDSDQNKKSEKVRFQQNIDAIKLLKRLEEENRMPTPAEQEVLGAYNGWGGLKKVFLNDAKENKELRELLTDEEYNAAKSTMNDAFYTPPKIVRAIWEGVSRLGFKGGRILDPSMGTGNFFGCMPRDMMKHSDMRGIERDGLTSRIAKQLYPNAYVETKEFQKAKIADNYFDLVISNVPFGNPQNKIDGYQLHNYFFANGMDKVRPGGLMVFITSQGTLIGGEDAAKMRRYLDGKADMIAAYKLPSGTFSEAGTDVATDVVIFQKRGENGQKSKYAQPFIGVTEKAEQTGAYSWQKKKLYDINEYFESHPENIIGNTKEGTDQYGNPVLEVRKREGETVDEGLSKAMKSLPENVYQPLTRGTQKPFNTTAANKRARADEKTRDLAYYARDGKIYQNQNGEEAPVTGKKAEVVKDYLAVKSALDTLYIAESDPKATDGQLDSLRKILNKTYDAFAKKHGRLNNPVTAKNFIDDPSAGMVQALEKVKYEGTGKNKKIKKVEKADVFTTRTVQAVQEIKSADTPSDALLASLSNKGTVDLDYMSDLLKSSKDKVVGRLTGKIFQNPVTEEYETREEYLSGNVREKLAQAEMAAKKDKSYQKNVDELKKVIPEDLVSSEILVNMGAPWIPVSDVQDFVTSIQGYGKLTAKFSPLLARWEVDGYGGNPKYEAKGIRLSEMLEAILNNKAIEIYTGPKKDQVLDKEATDAANVTADELRNDFNEWLWSDKEREDRLVRYYNDNYNNTVNREYDGSHLNPNAHGMNSKITLKPHQKNVVWRMLQKGNTLIAHCVGAGKTFEMQTAGMEMRRLGIANKPMYCLPNNVVEQFAREFRQLYPEAKLLVLQTKDLPAVPKTMEQTKTPDGRTVLTEKKLSAKDKERVVKARAERNRTLARVRTEDWDGIIISHDLFQRFPLSPETAADFIREQIDILERTISEAHDNKMSTRTLSSLENKKAALQDRLEDILNTNLDDIGIPFENLGIDQLFVDEADMFKNLHFATSMDRVSGLTNSDANRSNDMFAKTQWLTKAMGGRGVVFATGTPVSNTMAELYTMTRYLDMQGLKEKGLELFDNWIRTFSEIGSGIERRPDGNGYRKVNKVKRFINMAELNKMFRKFADVKTQDDLDLEIPKLKNDKATIVKLDADPEITRYIKEEVPKRVAKMKHAKKGEKGSDNMLALTGDLRKMSLNDDKIEACAEQIAKKYEETTDVKGTQLVFCDIGIPKAQKDTATDADAETFDGGEETENEGAYEKLIAALKRRGIPSKQIAFVQSAKNKEEMDALFQKVNEGDVRILIGSTQKMGAGTNCQKHLVALHDLDAPWRPRDLEQRHGRILRQGNDNKQVEIFNYVVQDSFDANMWEKLKNKAAIIAQAMSSDTTIRAVEDADLVTLSYAEVEGAATGNPLIKERLNLNNEVTKYAHAQTAFKRRQRDAENTVATRPDMIEEQKEIIGKIKDDIAARKDVSGDKFRMTISGKTYTERAKADEKLKSIFDVYKKGVATPVGEISGFKLSVYYDGTKPILQLVRNRAYPVQTPTAMGIQNALQNAPDYALSNHEGTLGLYEHQLSDAQETLKQENLYEEKLKEMTKRLAEIDREIEKSMTEEGSAPQTEAATDSVPMPTTETAAPVEKAEQNKGGESATVSESALEYDGNYFVQETDDYRKLAMGVDPQIRKFAEENGGKWEPGVAGNRGGFRFQTKSGAKEFLAGVDDVITKEKQRGKSTPRTQTAEDFFKEHVIVGSVPEHYGERAPVAKTSFEASIGKSNLRVSSDGYITGDTYHVKGTIKKYGAKWDKDKKAWHITDKNELNRFLENYGENYSGEILNERQEDVSKLSTQERIDRAVAASENNRNLAVQLGGEMQNGHMIFPEYAESDMAQTFLDAVNAQEEESAQEDKHQPISFSVDARIPHQAGSGTTQVAGTKSMYVKALRFLRNIKDNIKSVLDYGAGLGLGTDSMREANTDLKIDSFEPDPTRWKGKTKPTYTDNTKIKGKYDAILNTNVLNVVEPEIRDMIVKDIASLLEKDGVAIITTRGWNGDIALNKNYEAGSEPKSMWVNKTVKGEPVRVYQKGFDGNDLVDYIRSTLGEGYDIRKVSGFGKSAVVIRKTTDAKYSANSEAERMRRESRILPQGELEPRHRKIQAFGEGMGVPVVFFEGDPRLHGYHQGGVTFLNVRSEIPIQDVFWHESFHWMRNTNPELYADLMTRMEKMDIFSDDELDEYRESIGRPELTNEQAIEEMLADIMMDTERREDIMQRIAAADRGLIERFMAWLRETAKTFQEFMKNPDAGLTRAKIAAMNRAIAAFARKCMDKRGQRIFHVTPKGDVRLMNGEPLPSAAYSFAGETANTADNKKLQRAVDMAADGKPAREIFRETGWLRGKDGKWRFEIPDLLNKIDFSNVKKRGVSTLQRVYDNPKLYEAYPFLKRISVEAVKMEDDEYGQALGRTIQLNKDMMDDEETKKTLVHEIQHIIQGREGFAEGGTPESARESLGDNAAYLSVSDDDLYQRLGGEQEAREVERRAENAKELENAEKAFADARKNGSGAEIRAAKERLDRAKERAEEMPTPHDEDAIVIFDGKEIPVAAKKKTNAKENWENSLAGEKEEKGENKKHSLTDNQKTSLFDTIARHIDSYIKEQVAAGKQAVEVAKELQSENSRHRARILGAIRASLNDFIRHKNDKDFQRLTVERIHGAKNWSDQKISNTYDDYVTKLREAVNYAGQIYQELAIDRERAGEKHGVGGQLHNWRDAESQREAREGVKFSYGHSNQNGIKFSVNLGNKGRSGNQGGLSRGAKPSFMGIIRNKLAGFVGDGTMRMRKEMKDALEKAAGVAIRTGHIEGNVRTENGVIRSRNAYDWDSILPEAGKAIAGRLGLQKSDKMGDYIGRWILDGTLNEASQEAVDFQKAMRKHPEMQNVLLDARDAFDAWSKMDATERIKASVEWTKRGTLEKLILGETSVKDELAEAQKHWYDEWVEELGSLGRLEDSISRKTGKKISAEESAMRAFRLFRGATGKAMTLIEGKDAQAVDAIRQIFPNVNFTGFKTIHMILDEAGIRQDKEGFKNFMAYCIAKHALTIYKKNADLRMEQHQLERKLAEAKGEAEKQKLREQIVELGKDIMQVPTDSEADCLATIRKYDKRFGRAQRDLVRFSRVTSDIMRDSGLISNERYEEMQKAWPDYVPFFRVFDDNENVQFGDSLKHVSGSKRDLVNPLESIIRNTYEFVRRAEKNKCLQKVADLAKISDAGEYIQLVDDAKPEDKTVLAYYEGGKKKFIQTDPVVVSAIKNMGIQSSNMFIRILHFPAQIARAAFTMMNPSFAVRNILRDSADAYLYSKYGYNPLRDFIGGFMHAIKQDEMFWEWMSSGAAQASLISMDRDYTQSTIDKITKSFKERLVSNPLDILQLIGEYSEYATRIGTYARAKNEIIKRDATRAGMSAIAEAAFESRDLMDFARGGKASRSMNQLIIFSNASIQGWDKCLRTFDFRKDKKAAMAALARLAFSAILPSIFLFMLNYDKDWWKELPDWQKEKHWIMKAGNTIIRIPKGQDPMVQFCSNFVEKGLASMYNGDPINFNKQLRNLWKNTMPDGLPTAFMPLIEVGANYSFFTERSIVPQYQKKLPEKMQYGPHTSSFAKWLGEKSGIAPRHIDHIIAGYGGNLGKAVAGLPDVGAESLNRSLEEMPIISGLTIMPYKNPKTVQEYYEKLDEQEKLYNEFKETRVRPNGYDPVLYGRMKKARTALSKLTKQERALMNNPNIPLSERKARQEQIQSRRVQIMKRVMGR